MKILMLSGNGLFHHLLVPLLSFFSYLFLEAHDSRWYVPVIISLICCAEDSISSIAKVTIYPSLSLNITLFCGIIFYRFTFVHTYYL